MIEDTDKPLITYIYDEEDLCRNSSTFYYCVDCYKKCMEILAKILL